MKKVIFGVLCMFVFCTSYSAVCGYSEQKDLNVLANHVDYHYDHDDSTGLFSLTFVNVPNELYIVVDRSTRYPVNNSITLNGFTYGQQISITIKGSESSNCHDSFLRVDRFMFPYINKFYGDSRCVDHENLDICSNRFLNYELSLNSFYRLINEDTEIKKQQENKKEEEVVPTFWEKAWKKGKKYVIPSILVIVTSIITVSICNLIFRKIKHGI